MSTAMENIRTDSLTEDETVSSDSSSRRTSDSSWSTSRSQSSTDFTEWPRAEQVLQRRQHNAYSTLSELAQIRVINNLEYLDCGQTADGWLATVYLDLPEHGSFCSSGTASKKQDAKKIAATLCLSSLRLAMKLHDLDFVKPSPLSDQFEIQHVRSVGTTAKQASQLKQDQDHLDILKMMASSRSVMGSNVVFLSLDVETYDRTGREILEVGVSSVRASQVWDKTSITSCHLVVEDHLHLKNGVFCPDHRWDFNFGESELVQEKDLAEILGEKIRTATDNAHEVYFVGHSPHHDYEWLDSLGMNMDAFQFKLCDISRVYRAIYSPGGYTNLVNLGQMMESCGRKTNNLHNGGNDARYHIEMALALMEECSRSEWKHLDGLL